MLSSTPTPTLEQAQAIECFRTGESLAIEALAGTGKTTTLRQLVECGSPRGGKILYTTFGAKAVSDAKARFPKTCRVATNHGLAWGVGTRYANEGRLDKRGLKASELAHLMGWGDSTFAPYVRVLGGAYGVIQTLAAYCHSADDDVQLHHALPVAIRLCRNDHANAGSLARVLAAFAAEVWQRAVTPGERVPVTHDIYLKEWALSRPHLRFSTVLYDEAQDANPVVVRVLQEQEHAQLVIVGDRRQAIYGFRHAVNAMDSFPVVHRTHLTRSFRFGPEIAAISNAVLIDQCNSSVLLEGDLEQPGTIGPMPDPACVLARKNATLIGEVFGSMDRAKAGERFAVMGGVGELIELVDGVAQLQRGDSTAVPDLAEFDSWGDVVAASDMEAYSHLRMLVQLVNTYGTRELSGRLGQLRGNELQVETCKTVFSTAHKAKGAEFSSVRLTDDFVPKGPDGNPEVHGWSPEEGNLLYVACTRARRHLDMMECEAVTSSMARAWNNVPKPDVTSAKPVADVSKEDPFAVLDEPRVQLVAVDVAPRFGLREGDWQHPMIKEGVVTVSPHPMGTEVIVRASGYILFQAAGEVTELGRNHMRVTVKVGSAQLDVPPEAVVVSMMDDAIVDA
ncbi:UvrD-helicase domain-containing protein [Luteimonas sp. MHLX1A]|nr:UvrD-helicase domain-containing protein [Luteimonas sp. MHLX1A]MCD9046726.1 UvrD-helicase domain-containing protein [Luteimonas sp. MHLX1A]